MIRDKDPTIFRSPHGTLTLHQPAISQYGRHWATAPNIGAGIEGITEKVADQALSGNLPGEPRTLDRVSGYLYVVIPKPLERFAHAPPFPKLLEYQLNRTANSLIGMKDNLTHRVQDITDRKPFE